MAGAAVTVEIDYPDGTTARVTGRTRPTGIAVVRRHVTQTGTYTLTIFNAGWVASGGRAAPTVTPDLGWKIRWWGDQGKTGDIRGRTPLQVLERVR